MNTDNPSKLIRKSLYVMMVGFVYYTAYSCNSISSNPIEISVEEFLRQYDSKSAVLLDIRTRQEYERGHLPGAMLIDMYAPDAGMKLMELDRSGRYYVYCHSGLRSRSVVKRMRDKGFVDSYNIHGGMLHLARAGVTFTK